MIPRTRNTLIILSLCILAVGFVWAQDPMFATDAGGSAAGEPPGGWPDWLIVILGAILPWVFQILLGKLPGSVKMVIAYAVGGGIGIGVGFLVLGWKGWIDVLRNIAYLWASMQFIYTMVIKPIGKRQALAGISTALSRPYLPKG